MVEKVAKMYKYLVSLKINSVFLTVLIFFNCFYNIYLHCSHTDGSSCLINFINDGLVHLDPLFHVRDVGLTAPVVKQLNNSLRRRGTFRLNIKSITGYIHVYKEIQ